LTAIIKEKDKDNADITSNDLESSL